MVLILVWTSYEMKLITPDSSESTQHSSVNIDSEQRSRGPVRKHQHSKRDDSGGEPEASRHGEGEDSHSEQRSRGTVRKHQRSKCFDIAISQDLAKMHVESVGILLHLLQTWFNLRLKMKSAQTVQCVAEKKAALANLLCEV
ncbi:uncharacterized [Tachysurus ichikawai]